jgi:hypothetical protein
MKSIENLLGDVGPCQKMEISLSAWKFTPPPIHELYYKNP